MNEIETFGTISLVNADCLEVMATLPDNAFALTKGLCRESINIFKRIQFGIHYMTLWAESQGVNLDWHVRAKMRYNVTRPYKHGKKY